MSESIRTLVLLVFILTVPSRTPTLATYSYGPVIRAVPVLPPEIWFIGPAPIFLIDAPYGFRTPTQRSDDNAIPVFWGCLATMSSLYILAGYTQLHQTVVATFVFHAFILNHPLAFSAAFFPVAYIAKSILGQKASLLGVIFVLAFFSALLAFIGVTP